MNRAVKVLVVDDESYVRESLMEILTHEGFRVTTAAGGREAVQILEREPLDVVVADLSMPTGDGIELLKATGRMNLRVPVIVITGVGTVPDAVNAMKLGAHDLLQKPVEPDELVRLVRRAAEHRSLVGEVHRLRAALEGIRGVRQLVGSSQRMQELRAQLAQVAPTGTTVLVYGESGTGKELAAEELHRRSGREEGPFVLVRCAGLAPERFEAELFGHRRGGTLGADEDRAGQLEQAEGGTLVLDEVGALRPEIQEKFLRLIDSGEYERLGESTRRRLDTRLIGLTNQDLGVAVERGTFRADLYYRLNAFPVRIPPLRERKEDLPELVEHLLERLRSSTEDRALPGVTPELIEILSAYDWPGNVRELENVIERAVIVGGARELYPGLVASILESTLPQQQPTAQGPRAAGSLLGANAPHSLHLRTNLDRREKELLQQALAESGGRKKDAASLLGVDARNLGYYLRKHGLQGG